MEQELKRKIILDNYRQDVFLTFHNFKQNELSIEKYTTKFDHLMMKCDLMEAKEQTDVGYLWGLRSNIGNVMQLQPYWSCNDVYKLAFKVEKQPKEAHGSSSHFVCRDCTSNQSGTSNQGSTSNVKSNTGMKSISKTTTKSDRVAGHKQQPPNANSCWCFKCQGYGNITSKCLNRKIVTLVEEENDEENKVENEVEPTTHEEDEEMNVIYGDQEDSFFIRKKLKCCPWTRRWLASNNIFHIRCTSHGKVYNVIIEVVSFENVVST